MTLFELTRPLDAHEAVFVEQVRRHLLDVPAAQRAGLVSEVEQHLTDRPRTRDRCALVADLGGAADYAAVLRFDHGLPPERTDWWARWLAIPLRRRVLRLAAVAVALALLVGGALTYAWWIGWRADLHNGNFNVSYANTTSREGITESSAGGQQQTTVVYRSGERLDLYLLLFAAHRAAVTNVSLDSPYGPMPPLAIVAVDRVDWASSSAATLHFHSLRAGETFAVDPRLAGTWVRLVLRFQHCTVWPGGGGMSWDSVRVTYRAVGRTRVEQVPIGGTLAVVGPPAGACHH